MIYRSTEKPLDHTGQDQGFLIYFQTHQPGEYWFDPRGLDKFLEIYGEEALRILGNKCLVPENVDPIWVGGGAWNDPAKRIRQVYFEAPEPEQPLVPGPDEEIWINPITGQPQIRKRKPLKIGDLTVTEFIQLMRSLLA